MPAYASPELNHAGIAEMEVPYDSFLSSPIVTVKGPSRDFFVHSGLLARHSPILLRRLHDSLKETNHHVIRVNDMDGATTNGTVMCFIEYAYKGDYTVPEKLENVGEATCTFSDKEDGWSLANSPNIKLEAKEKVTADSRVSIDVTLVNYLNTGGSQSSCVTKPRPNHTKYPSSTTSGAISIVTEPTLKTKTEPFQENEWGWEIKADIGADILKPKYESKLESAQKDERFPNVSLSNKGEGQKKKIRAPEAQDTASDLFGGPFHRDSKPILTVGSSGVYTSKHIPKLPQQQTVTQKKEKLWSAFKSPAITKDIPYWEPRKCEAVSAGNDYTVNLVFHAQLYVFSQLYECIGLAELALQKLRLALSQYDAGQGVSPVSKLVEYTYAHTLEDEGQCDDLKEVVIEYLVCHLENFMKEHDFKKLLRQDHTLARDLLTKAMDRLESQSRIVSQEY